MREICITLLLLFCVPVFAIECDVCKIAFDAGDQVIVDEATATALITVPERIPINIGESLQELIRATIPTADTAYIRYDINVTAYVSRSFEVGWRG